MHRFAQENQLDWSVYCNRYLVLNRFFADTLRFQNGEVHYPPTYDFEDPLGSRDWQKMFVHKLLNTNTGQCHSLPLLYKILADELGVKAWLSFSPNHTFIKFQDENGKIYNFETTNGHLASDKWLIASGYIRQEALKNRIYMDTLSQVATVWYCVMDLADAYAFQFGYQDGFISRLSNLALTINPKDISALIHLVAEATFAVANEARRVGQPPVSELDKYPTLKAKVLQMHQLQQKVETLGYSQMSHTEYEKWRQGGRGK
jgi:hypothetical protein